MKAQLALVAMLRHVVQWQAHHLHQLERVHVNFS
jgi:hypothetical protein